MLLVLQLLLAVASLLSPFAKNGKKNFLSVVAGVSPYCFSYSPRQTSLVFLFPVHQRS
jgi:hypothetical protein